MHVCMYVYVCVCVDCYVAVYVCMSVSNSTVLRTLQPPTFQATMHKPQVAMHGFIMAVELPQHSPEPRFRGIVAW